MIEEQFVSFDTARMLKEAGFKERVGSCFMYEDEADEYEYEFVNGYAIVKKSLRVNYNDYENTISRPTQALAARWLREGHGLFIEIFYRITGFNYEIIYTKTDEVAFTPHEPKINFISYEGCLEDALQEAVKLIKK